MDIGKSFSFPFEDEKWLSKSLIGVIVAIIPIVNFAWGGYLIDLLKAVVNDDPKPLPEWSNFGDKFTKGLFLVAASIVYAIPLLILACIPLTLLGGMSTFQEGADVIDRMGGVFAGVGGIFGCLALLYSLFLTFIYPAIYIHFARLENFGAFFEFGNIMKIIRANTGQYLTAWLVSLVAGVLVSIVVGLVTTVLGWIPCLGWIIAWIVSGIGYVYTFYVFAHLFGQYARASRGLTVSG
jgi:hypothetical protein